jgi:hypothetical protein
MGTSREDYAALLPTVQGIVHSLNVATTDGGSWVLRADEECTPYFHITNAAKSAELLISTEYGKPERLVINGVTPRGKDRQYVRVYEQGADGSGWTEFKFSSISVATKRGAEAIAKEITRRFLPDYLKAVSLTLERIARDENFEAQRLANLQACAATLNEVINPPYGHNTRIEDRTEFSHYFGANCSGIRVECKASANDVDLKIENLTVEQAKQVLALAKHLALPRNPA